MWKAVLEELAVVHEKDKLKRFEERTWQKIVFLLFIPYYSPPFPAAKDWSV